MKARANSIVSVSAGDAQKSALGPRLLSHQRQCVSESGVSRVVLGRLPENTHRLSQMAVYEFANQGFAEVR
jgi:hypothetical protein